MSNVWSRPSLVTTKMCHLLSHSRSPHRRACIRGRAKATLLELRSHGSGRGPFGPFLSTNGEALRAKEFAETVTHPLSFPTPKKDVHPLAPKVCLFGVTLSSGLNHLGFDGGCVGGRHTGMHDPCLFICPHFSCPLPSRKLAQRLTPVRRT